MLQANVYFDESCHLLKDNSNALGIGCVYCLEEHKKQIMYNIRTIKRKHGFNKDHEIKWTRVSNNKIQLYKDLIDYFFCENKLYFRGVVTLNKDQLVVSGEEEYRQWYEKMNYYLFNKIINPCYQYRIFLDKRDTKGKENLKKLKTVICNSKYDFSGETIKSIEDINSNNNDLIQMTDLLIGILTYYHRGLTTSPAKMELVKYLSSKVNISKTSMWSETKFNILVWSPNEKYSRE
jgi:hypothetical protein